MELVSSALRPIDDKAAGRAIARFLSASADGVPESVVASLTSLQAALADGDNKPPRARKPTRARRESTDAGAAAGAAGAGAGGAGAAR